MSGPQLLKAYLGRTKLKQYELADLLELTESYLSQLLSGRRKPGRANSLKIEELTGVPIRSWSDSASSKSAAAGRARVHKAQVRRELNERHAS